MNNKAKIIIPDFYSFKNFEIYDFDKALNIFNWNLCDCEVEIDSYNCMKANYQAMALVPLYVWHLRSRNCHIKFKFRLVEKGAYQMWRYMGAQGWSQVLNNSLQNFNGHPYKPLIAIRNTSDLKKALYKAETYSKGFNVEYEKTLRYVLSELLYNTIEHGKTVRTFNNVSKQIPSVIQFTWYKKQNELHFMIADLGIGIKSHLEQTYPTFESHTAAILESIKYQVSGTFGSNNPYKSKDNAGVGLYISSNIIQKLDADMHVLSGNGLVHVSPRDITSHTISNSWPGTLVLVSLRLGDDPKFNLQKIMSQLRESAKREISEGEARERNNIFYIYIKNYFGSYAEDKESAIKFRNDRIIPAIESGQSLLLDFRDVKSAPHSFLSALLATPIHRLGMKAYKLIKVVSAEAEIRETIDYILDDNTPKDSD